MVLSQVIQLAHWVTDSAEWLSELDDDWRTEEYVKLSSLRAGMSAQLFEEHLGAPSFVASDDNGETQKHFAGRDYWVMTVENSAGTVIFYSVTTCDMGFRPTFRMVLGESVEVTLLQSRLTDFDDIAVGTISFHIGASAYRGGLYQTYYAGNPSNYKTFGLATHEACPTTASLDKAALLEIPASSAVPGLSTQDPRLYEVRSRAMMNTYFETDVFVDLPALAERWGYGPDYVTIRNHPSFEYPAP